MRYCLLIFSLFASLLTKAQLPDYHVQLFDESFGINTVDMRRVITDKQDFVWIMDIGRVQRFDGKDVKDFELEPSLNSILCDNDGRIWVASAAHLFRSDVNNQGFNTIPVDTLKYLQMYQVYNLVNLGICVLTNKGVYVFDKDLQIFKKHPDPRLGNLNTIYGRGMDDGQNTNTLFFMSGDSMMAYRPNTGLLTGLLANSLPARNVQKLTAITDNTALVSTWSGTLFLYDFSNGKISNIDLSGHLKNVQDFFMVVFEAIPVSENKYMIATLKGLMEYNSITGDLRPLKLYYKGRPLEGNQILYDLHVDRHGTVWVIYNNYGLISFKKDASEIGLMRNNETDVTKAWDNNVRNFAEDDKGNLWLATMNGFVRWNLQDGVIQPFFAIEGAVDRLNYNGLRGIVYDGRDLILGQTNHGLWIFNPSTNKYKRPLFLPGKSGDSTRIKIEDDFINQIYTLHNGDHVISAREGVYILEKEKYILHELDFEGKKENIDFCYEDTKKNCWIGTRSNLHCLDSNFIERFKIPVNKTNGFVNAVCEWIDGTMIAGANGLYSISYKDAPPVINKIDTFFDHINIRIIYRDKLDKIWLATSEGLFRYDITAHKVESFSHFEYIKGNSFYPNSFCRSKQGLLFMGSTRGIIYFNPEQMKEEKDSLNIIISNIVVNGDTSYSVSNPPGKLKYFQNAIAFEFVTPYFGNANKLKYRYRLQGLENEWIENGNTSSARFHALQPGDYVFQASVSNNGKDWFESKEKISFNISPPFWKTWWFYGLAILTIATSLYGLNRYQLNKKLEVERLRMGIARDLHDDIGSALTNIHIISSMAMKIKSENDAAGQVFSKIKESSETMMDNMQDIVWAINPENDTLSQVLAKMKEFAGELCEASGIDYKFEAEPSLESIKLDLNMRKDLFLIFKEAMNNAVKYSGCSLIKIGLHRKPGMELMMTISDNGRGFIQKDIRPGNGLRNMNQRAKELNGQMVIESGNGSGTTIELRIPIT